MTPSIRSCRNESSRLGPTVPVELACESVWQEAQFVANSFLPVTRLAVGCLSEQPPTVTAIMAAAMSVEIRPSDLTIRETRDSIRAVGTGARRPRPRVAGLRTAPPPGAGTSPGCRPSATSHNAPCGHRPGSLPRHRGLTPHLRPAPGRRPRQPTPGGPDARPPQRERPAPPATAPARRASAPCYTIIQNEVASEVPDADAIHRPRGRD